MSCYGGNCSTGIQRYVRRDDREKRTLLVAPEPTEAGIYFHTKVEPHPLDGGITLSLAQVERLIEDLIRMRRELRRVDL